MTIMHQNYTYSTPVMHTHQCRILCSDVHRCVELELVSIEITSLLCMSVHERHNTRTNCHTLYVVSVDINFDFNPCCAYVFVSVSYTGNITHAC